jgi:hypothetical protein
MDESTFDPICDHVFDLYKSTSESRPFCPRLGHIGYKLEINEDVKTKSGKSKTHEQTMAKLQQLIPSNKNIMDGYKKYTINDDIMKL